MALTVWDATTGASREATQKDIDLLQAKANALGRLFTEFRSVEHFLAVKTSEIHDHYRRTELLSGDL